MALNKLIRINETPAYNIVAKIAVMAISPNGAGAVLINVIRKVRMLPYNIVFEKAILSSFSFAIRTNATTASPIQIANA
jgi:hypothetical protein